MSTVIRIDRDERLQEYLWEWPSEISDLELGEGDAAAILSHLLKQVFSQIQPAWDAWFIDSSDITVFQLLENASRRAQDALGMSLDEFIARDLEGNIEPSLAAAEIRVMLSSAYGSVLPPER